MSSRGDPRLIWRATGKRIEYAFVLGRKLPEEMSHRPKFTDEIPDFFGLLTAYLVGQPGGSSSANGKAFLAAVLLRSFISIISLRLPRQSRGTHLTQLLDSLTRGWRYYKSKIASERPLRSTGSECEFADSTIP
jgi:hypothetical protein